MELLHRYRRPFVGINAALMAIFGLAALIAPTALWGVMGVDVETSPLVRVMAWYLLTFGVGALLATPRPEDHPIVVALVGLEKVGPAVVFNALYAMGQANPLLATAGLFDGVMAVVFLRYAWWLRSRSDQPPSEPRSRS